jgi:uncharacterized RmlC-like cupin family protein
VRCDYCCRDDHSLGECPHMAAHLLDPNPKFNGLRGFARVIDGAFERVGAPSLSAQVLANAQTVTGDA